MKMKKLNKLKRGDKVAILSPSFAAPGKWPDVYELGLKRLREIFELEPVEFPTTKKIGASGEERSADLIDAFSDPEIKAVISTLGGDDQITYIKNLPLKPFADNPKPFFGYSDNTHFENFLWLNCIPSYYGGSLFVQFAEQGKMNDFTIKYLKLALFEEGEFEIEASELFNEIGLDWNQKDNLTKSRVYEKNPGWKWEKGKSAEGITWGGCLESIDEMLRHSIKIPSLEEFENIILMTETSEEIPTSDYVFRVYRALGERGILEKVKGLIVGRPKSWEFNKQYDVDQREKYRNEQYETINNIFRKYNNDSPVVQNLNFGHTDPQIAMPYGGKIKIDVDAEKIFAAF